MEKIRRGELKSTKKSPNRRFSDCRADVCVRCTVLVEIFYTRLQSPLVKVVTEADTE